MSEVPKEVTEYVQQQRATGHLDQTVHDALVEAGWDVGDVVKALELSPTPRNAARKPRKILYLFFILGSTLLWIMERGLRMSGPFYWFPLFPLIFFGYIGPLFTAVYQAHKGYLQRTQSGLALKMITRALLCTLGVFVFVFYIPAGSAENYVLYMVGFLMGVGKFFIVLSILSVVCAKVIYNAYDRPNHWFKILPFLIWLIGIPTLFIAVIWISLLYYDTSHCGVLGLVDAYSSRDRKEQNAWNRTMCWIDRAEESNDPSLCQRAPDRDYCIVEFAIHKHQGQLCEQIAPSYNRSICDKSLNPEKMEKEFEQKIKAQYESQHPELRAQRYINNVIGLALELPPGWQDNNLTFSGSDGDKKSCFYTVSFDTITSRIDEGVWQITLVVTKQRPDTILASWLKDYSTQRESITVEGAKSAIAIGPRGTDGKIKRDIVMIERGGLFYTFILNGLVPGSQKYSLNYAIIEDKHRGKVMLNDYRKRFSDIIASIQVTNTNQALDLCTLGKNKL